MIKWGRERGQGLREVAAAATFAFLSFEAPPVAAQNIRATTTWEEGVNELERVAAEERREGGALYISTGAGGQFVDLRSSRQSISRTFENYHLTYARIAEAADAAYAEAVARGETPEVVRILMLHTHPAQTLRRVEGRLGPIFDALVARNVPLTMPPSGTDLEGPQMLDGIGVRGNLQVVPPDLVSLQYAVTDELLTYYYSFEPTSLQEEDEALLAYQETAAALDQAVADVVTFLETLPPSTISGAGLSQNHDEIIVEAMYAEPRWVALDAFLRSNGQEALATRLRDTLEARRAGYARAYPREVVGETSLDEARVAWSVYVADAQAAGETWDTILASEQYASLLTHYRSHGFVLRAVPNEKAEREDPFVLSPSSPATP